MDNKRILLLGGNYFPEPTGIGKFNGEMIEWLTANDYLCTVITTYPYYPFWKVQPPYLKTSYTFKHEIKNLMSYYATPIEIYRCPQYVPKNPSGRNRIFLDITFFLSSLIIILKLLFEKKHDYVISVVPSFQIGLLAMLYKTIRGAKFFYHIQDLQIEAARDLKMIKSAFILKLLFRVEKWILTEADVVSSISEGMIKKVRSKCDRDIIFFPNWVDTKLFYPIEERADLKIEFGFKTSDIIILYSGAIGEKQGLEIILDAARALSSFPDIKFLISGSGPYLDKLFEIKNALNLRNVIFIPLQPIEKLNRFLNMADVHLIVQKADSSDLVMPSKLTNILAIGGVAIVTALKNSSLYKIISEHSIGVLTPPEDRDELLKAIRSCVFNNNKTISISARRYAENFLSIDKVMTNYSINMEESIDINLSQLQLNN